MIKTIFFDYAGVITPTRDNYLFAQKYHQRFGLEAQELMSKTYKNWDQATVGQISYRQFWQGVVEELNIDPIGLRDLIIETFPIDQRMIELIDNIKNNFTIVMVSNQVQDWLEKVINDNNLKDRFDYFVNSYQVGASKPEPKIFLAALEQSHSTVEETLFVDDTDKNIVAAKELGIQTIQFDDFEQFIADFRRFMV